MRRCIQLAKAGMYTCRPNPMVGAVIVACDRIIGEGFHYCAGEPHAEVNAFRNVRKEDEKLLAEATLFVSLEPCSHYGKTPPCAKLIIEKGVKRVVVGCRDLFPCVNGTGVDMLRDAGIEVIEGVQERDCKQLNRHFFTLHGKNRPYITLKWAESVDGFIDNDGKAMAFSSEYTKLLVHKMRATYDAIVVGRVTDEREKPQLNVRYWHGKVPHRYVLSHENTIDDIIEDCRKNNYLSLLVEGGSLTLASFIERGMYDSIRREVAPIFIGRGTKAPQLPSGLQMIDINTIDDRQITTFQHIEP